MARSPARSTERAAEEMQDAHALVEAVAADRDELVAPCPGTRSPSCGRRRATRCGSAPSRRRRATPPSSRPPRGWRGARLDRVTGQAWPSNPPLALPDLDPQPPAVILNQPQLAENIGAVARVMANFGLDGPAPGQRRATAGRRSAPGPAPRAPTGRWTTPRCSTPSPRTPSPTCKLVFATTARPRETSPAGATPRARPRRSWRPMAAGPAGRPAVRRRAGGAGDRGHRPVPGHRHHPHRPALPLAEPGPGGGDQRLRVADGVRRPPRRRFRQRVAARRPGRADGPVRPSGGRARAAGFFHPPAKKPRWSATCASSSPAPA